jgi:hypothetical protein
MGKKNRARKWWSDMVDFLSVNDALLPWKIGSIGA